MRLVRGYAAERLTEKVLHSWLFCRRAYLRSLMTLESGSMPLKALEAANTSRRQSRSRLSSATTHFSRNRSPLVVATSLWEISV